ncbi:hypothetical protein KNP414_06270 [Paenibacillus mucilaginosus KNP414]|uniref:Uncharacterized protein n=1 Tax=Paenibacillus mucilaginosus (strain KNP414) TaxID=1036673 RepID=F8FKB1_PAEMK|nr:hypothetical protein KNP414_06270 [Paenibacillus mucilaginosus KNP414]
MLFTSISEGMPKEGISSLYLPLFASQAPSFQASIGNKTG